MNFNIKTSLFNIENKVQILRNENVPLAGNHYLRAGFDIFCTFYFPINFDQDEKWKSLANELKVTLWEMSLLRTLHPSCTMAGHREIPLYYKGIQFTPVKN